MWIQPLTTVWALVQIDNTLFYLSFNILFLFHQCFLNEPHFSNKKTNKQKTKAKIKIQNTQDRVHRIQKAQQAEVSKWGRLSATWEREESNHKWGGREKLGRESGRRGGNLMWFWVREKDWSPEGLQKECKQATSENRSLGNSAECTIEMGGERLPGLTGRDLWWNIRQ